MRKILNAASLLAFCGISVIFGGLEAWGQTKVIGVVPLPVATEPPSTCQMPACASGFMPASNPCDGCVPSGSGGTVEPGGVGQAEEPEGIDEGSGGTTDPGHVGGTEESPQEDPPRCLPGFIYVQFPSSPTKVSVLPGTSPEAETEEVYGCVRDDGSGVPGTFPADPIGGVPPVEVDPVPGDPNYNCAELMQRCPVLCNCPACPQEEQPEIVPLPKPKRASKKDKKEVEKPSSRKGTATRR